MEHRIYAQIEKIADPTLRNLAQTVTRLVLENWLYVALVLFLWRYPYIVADWTDTEVMPRRPTGQAVFWQSEMARALLLACLAMSYNLLFGYTGIISFGHALFFGAGGYVTFILMSEYDASARNPALIAVLAMGLLMAVFSKVSLRNVVIFVLIGAVLALALLPADSEITFYQAAGLAVLVSIALSVVSGVVTLRLRGIYFTMFTLALSEMFFVLAKSGTFRDITGAEDGLGFREILPESLNPTPTFDGSRMDMYRITIVFFVIVLLAIRRYLNSPVGRVILAIRENEERARTIGYNTFYYKVLTMTFAGVIATLTGILSAIWATDKRIHPEALSLKFTVDPLLHVLIGGVGTLTGPIVAALSLVLGETYLRDETFALDTHVAGTPLLVWQALTLVVVAIVMWLFRRLLREGAIRVMDRFSQYTPQTVRTVYYTIVTVILTVVGLIIGSQVAQDKDLKDRVFEVADLWELALGIVFVIVVMVLPMGIVGTWNKFLADRRIRRMERQLQQENSHS